MTADFSFVRCVQKGHANGLSGISSLLLDARAFRGELVEPSDDDAAPGLAREPGRLRVLPLSHVHNELDVLGCCAASCAVAGWWIVYGCPGRPPYVPPLRPRTGPRTYSA